MDEKMDQIMVLIDEITEIKAADDFYLNHITEDFSDEGIRTIGNNLLTKYGRICAASLVLGLFREYLFQGVLEMETESLTPQGICNMAAAIKDGAEEFDLVDGDTSITKYSETKSGRTYPCYFEGAKIATRLTMLEIEIYVLNEDGSKME